MTIVTSVMIDVMSTETVETTIDRVARTEKGVERTTATVESPLLRRTLKIDETLGMNDGQVVILICTIHLAIAVLQTGRVIMGRIPTLTIWTLDWKCITHAPITVEQNRHALSNPLRIDLTKHLIDVIGLTVGIEEMVRAKDVRMDPVEHAAIKDMMLTSVVDVVNSANKYTESVDASCSHNSNNSLSSLRLQWINLSYHPSYKTYTPLAI